MAHSFTSVSSFADSTSSTKVAVVGSIHMDFINIIDNHPELGGHVQTKEVIHTPGGHGANQAVACARLSKLPRDFLIYEPGRSNGLAHRYFELEVFMFGVVGDQDIYGEEIKAELKRNHVNTDGIYTVKGEKTGYAHVNVNSHGGSTVYSTRGASKNFLPGPMFNPTVKPHVVLVQLEIPMEMVVHALLWAKEQRATTICNAAPATRSTLPEEVSNVDHFIVNEQQADELNGIDVKKFEPSDRFNNRAKIRQHYQDLCEKFHNDGATCVVITMGELGVVGSRKDPVTHVRQQYIFDAEQGDDPVKDTTGASDTFIGGYTAELVHQKQAGIKEDMASAIRLGIKAAGLCVSVFGSMPAIPLPEAIMNTTFRAASI